MNIIDERKARTIRRKLRKREFDNMMTLSAKHGDVQTVRLLDEGAVMGYNSPLFYIKKGTLAKYLRKLPKDYVGTINLGHMDFATFPFILGTWTKKDMHLVDLGDGRQALDVDLRLDEGNVFVQELRRAPYTMGVSAEFTYHVDEENTKKFNLEILDEIFIGNFAIVGECGNVNSSGIRLSGGEGMTIQELTAALDGEHTDLGEINKKLDALLEDEKQLTTAEEEEAAAAEEPEEEAPVEEAEAPAAENKEELAETEDAEKEVSAEQPEEEKKELAAVESMFKELTAKLEAMAAENARLQARLDAKEKAEQDFIARFKNLSVSLSSTESVTEVAEAPAEQVVFTDGIGEF